MQRPRAAKIVCTLGPAVSSAQGVAALVAAGMDVARLNLSHGDHATHAEMVEWVRRAGADSGRPVAVLADLQGPKIRLGRFREGRAELRAGQPFTITTDDRDHLALGSSEGAATTYAQLAEDVRPGDPILIDDGRVRLEVVETDGTVVTCVVVEGGVVSDHKGINLPDVPVSASALSDKDETDLRFALAAGVDLVALSFVRRAADADPVRAVMADCGISRPVFAKIEKPEAVAQLDAILDAFDGIMVARGDLGVEMPLEQVPLVQKHAITAARQRAKPVIVATQMLESMVSNSRPTRAEASDVANAVLDGADAVMLSAETSVGRHPIDAVRTMARIIDAVQRDPAVSVAPIGRSRAVGPAIATVADELADDIGARAIVAFTESGGSARFLAAHRPERPILGFTPYPEVCRQLAVVWGVEPFVMPAVAGTDAMIAHVEVALTRQERVRSGDVFVVVAGTPPGTRGSTNTLRVHRVV